MSKLVHHVQQLLADYLDRPIILAYSGGVDSQVLLDILYQLNKQKTYFNRLEVCHVNHGLSKNAYQWQAFAVAQCKQRDLALTVHQVEINRKNQQSLEQLARDARYQALNAYAQQVFVNKKPVVLTGHHQADQAETFLLALKRGAGLKGLAAMPVCIKRENYDLVRPLLDISQQEIIDYAKQHNLAWVEDESNQDICFDRNFLRQQVIPLLTARWPAIQKTISRSSQHCQEAQSLLNDMAEIDLQTCLVNDEINKNALSVTKLKQLSIARFNNLIRYFIAQHDATMPTSEQLKQLYNQLHAGVDKAPEIKLAEVWFRRYRDLLFITTALLDVSSFSQTICLNEKKQVISLPDNLGTLVFEFEGREPLEFLHNNEVGTQVIRLKAPQKGEQVEIRFTHQNPQCLPDYRQHHRSLKKVLQELNIAPWQRKRIAFLFYDNELVAALGYFICKPYLPSKADEVLTIVQRQT